MDEECVQHWIKEIVSFSRDFEVTNVKNVKKGLGGNIKWNMKVAPNKNFVTKTFSESRCEWLYIGDIFSVS